MTTVYNKNGVGFDIDAIATDLNGKLDRDCLNVSDTGKIQMAGMGMPSNKYIDLTLGALGAIYTAPANGWFIGDFLINAGGYVFAANIKDYRGSNPWDYTGRTFITNQYSGNQQGALILAIPVCKGDGITITYGQYSSTRLFRFVYAEGEV